MYYSDSDIYSDGPGYWAVDISIVDRKSIYLSSDTWVLGNYFKYIWTFFKGHY